MGVKELWNVLTPYCDRKPVHSLHFKTVAIDLAGWICESLNVLDYFVNPKHYLRNLFSRTCYLIWENVTPVFVLDGAACKLKSTTITKRMQNQFRGAKPKGNTKLSAGSCSRSKFNHVLKECEALLTSMGILCVKAPGEAEAYCAFLNKSGLVDGVISQDSDCFAYGAVCVYRNFSVSNRSSTLQSGFIDIYDMNVIRKSLDFGQNKSIAMALLCGCDYCPDGVEGISRERVMRFLNKYREDEILDKVRSLHCKDYKYTTREMRADDKSVCSSCGHLGKQANHSKQGCVPCNTINGCNESLWKEERLSIQAELFIRKKVESYPVFPPEDIINEFLCEPSTLPDLQLAWGQPNFVKFMKVMCRLLQWTEIDCFQKFFPIITRWHVRNFKRFQGNALVVPLKILQKRIIKGVPNLVVFWKDELGTFEGLIPDEQLKEFDSNNNNGLQDLWTTTEPLNLLSEAYNEMVQSFLLAGSKSVKATSKGAKKERANQQVAKLNTNKFCLRNYFKSKKNGFKNDFHFVCSSPQNKLMAVDLDSSNALDHSHILSDLVNEIVIKKTGLSGITKHDDRSLMYERIRDNLDST